MFPCDDGLECLRHLREWSTVPVLILSARPDPTDKVRALDLGADDYLTKPFDAPELLARHAGRVLTHAHLLNAVWGPKATEQSHYLRVHFTHLRRKLRNAGLAAEAIRNELGIGYRLMLANDPRT